MEMSDNDLQKLNSSLREVLAYIKYQRDKARMEKLLNEDSKVQLSGNKCGTGYQML